MAKKKEYFGLPDLTIEEAAFVLGVDTGEFIRWLLDAVRPSPSEWTRWNLPPNRKWHRPLPEWIIRLYLVNKMRKTVPSLSPPNEIGAGERRRLRHTRVGGQSA